VRTTRQGTAIDDALAGLGGFHTAQSLHDELRRRGEPVGLTTVYRQLKKLAADGRVDMVLRPDGEAAYRMCGPAVSDGSSDHHHHLVCRICGDAVEVAGPEVERWAQQVAADAGFTAVDHTVEIFGECAKHAPARVRRR
jgi:Fur family ferric uptake transcriptional regulator